MKTYHVIGRPLTLNRRTHQPGETIEFAEADAEILIGRGRIGIEAVAAEPPEPGERADEDPSAADAEHGGDEGEQLTDEEA